MAVDVAAPLGGKISGILCNVGDRVSREDDLMVLEAMKMEIPICAPVDGKVVAIKVAKGATVEPDDLLLIID